MSVFLERIGVLLGLRDNRKVIWAVGVSVLAAFYYLFCVGTLSVPLFTHSDPVKYYDSFRFDEINPGHKGHYGFYNLLADGFLQGHTYLPVAPDPRMLALSNPLDSTQNNGLRLHDVSLFKEKYYLYFGPTPALTLFMPARLLGFGKLTEPYAVWLFSVGAFLCAAYIVTRLLALFRIEVTLRLYVLLLALLAFSGPLAYVLRRPIVYEVALTAGAFYGALGFAALMAGWKDGRPTKLGAGLASLFWGLAVGCRPNLVILGGALFVLWYVCFRKKGAAFGRESLIAACFTAGPFALIVTALLIYNAARFGKVSEFGANFQLSGDSLTERGFHANQFSLINIPLNAWNAILNGPGTKAFFPFLDGVAGAGSKEMLGKYFASEPIVGLGWSTPAIVLGVIVFLGGMLKRCFSKENSWALVWMCLGYGVLPMLFSFWLVPGITMRYLVDYCFGLSVLGCVGVSLSLSLVSGINRRILKVVYVILAVSGLGISGMLGFSGYHNLYKQVNPGQYFGLADTLGWVERLFASNTQSGRIEVLDVLSPSGMTYLEDRSTAMLVGPEPVFIRVTSPAAKELFMQFKAIPARETADISISSGAWSSQVAVGKTVSVKGIAIPLERGSNLIRVIPLGDLQESKGPVCGITGLNFSQAKP